MERKTRIIFMDNCRKKGLKIDPELEKLQKRRPCVGLCYLLRKKMDDLEIEDDNFP